ncbi:MAG: hypothetical protein KDH16_09965 [Rhodocyclaceae bacterium]|nr:hypothetical protein [Rhodocyclaceae bacterium]
MSEIRKVINTPPETGNKTITHLQNIQGNKHRSMPLPIPGIGNDGHSAYFADLMPGNTCAILAQTHNGKTFFMEMWEKALANHLVTQGRDDEIIIRVDVENAIEELGMMEVSRLTDHSIADLSRGNVRDWGSVIHAAGQIGQTPIYRIADPLGDDEAPELYLSNIYRAIKYIKDGSLTGSQLRVACIFIDYLQALPYDPEVKQHKNLDDQRRLQVRRDMYRIKKMAKHFACPVVFGVQAKQQLNNPIGPNMLIPGVYDGEESSSIAQRTDRSISLWMPKQTHQIGQRLAYAGKEYEVTENMMWVKVLKQRGGLPSGRMWPCELDFKSNSIKPIEL